MRELVALDDVVADEELGPNGGLVRCMELLLDNLDWLEEQLGQYNDDYLIIDCPGLWPCRAEATARRTAVGLNGGRGAARCAHSGRPTGAGQIELYTHFPIMKRIKDALLRLDYAVCAVYLIDAQFIEVRRRPRASSKAMPPRALTAPGAVVPHARRPQDPAKFFAGTLTALSTMIQLEVPHINVLSKMDLFDKKQRRAINRCALARGGGRPGPAQGPTSETRGWERAAARWCTRYLNADTTLLLSDLNATMSPRYHALNRALASLVRAQAAPSSRVRAQLTSGSEQARRLHGQIDEYGMVSYIPMDINSEKSVARVLSHVDNAIQFGEDEEPKEHDVRPRRVPMEGDRAEGRRSNGASGAWRPVRIGRTPRSPSPCEML